MTFYKYHGTGNDFIMVDNRAMDQSKDLDLIRKICSRRFGIGSDGIIYLEHDESLDFNMDFFNPDGSQSFCGNGSRCAVSFAHTLGMIGDNCRFRAIDGEHEGRLEDGLIKVRMRDVGAVEVGPDHYFIHTGSPHYIEEVGTVEDVDMISFGRSIRYNDRFKVEGTNVNAVQKETDHVKMRTYERGVENETLSCGTGVTAVALSAMHKGWFNHKVHVHVPGGELWVEAEQQGDSFNNIWLMGKATFVFKGEIDV